MEPSCSSSSVLDSGGLEVLVLPNNPDVSTGSFDFHRDPPAQCHGAQTDPPVPALRFCGQLAQWTGNSTNYQVRAAHATLVGDVGINSTIFFEASPGEVASSRLELRNEGNTSIFYSWQQLDVSSSLSHLLSHRRRSCSTSTSPQGASVQVTLMGSLCPRTGRQSSGATWRCRMIKAFEPFRVFPIPPVHFHPVLVAQTDKAGKTVTEKFCRSMVYKILEGVQTRERSSSLVEFLMGSPEVRRNELQVRWRLRALWRSAPPECRSCRAVLGWSITAAIQLSGLHASAEEYDSVKSRSELMFEKQSGRHGLVTRVTHAATVKPQEEGGASHQLYAEIKPAVDGATTSLNTCATRTTTMRRRITGAHRSYSRPTLPLLVTPVMIFGTVIIFLRGICNQPPHLPFKGDPHDYREENPRLL
ncbi:Acetylcholine receptor subunit delta [Takifugu flavidus]|uniref:Acetylcholine receptor subunit delta n=1 Tax=Takifugu flavidus TaxID=433684 RepID=A0A5C6MGA3_9TELE|nr:Acetylcholine receptor subunit delta [Takifugu flavidus]